MSNSANDPFEADYAGGVLYYINQARNDPLTKLT